MDTLARAFLSPNRIELALEADFTVGALKVRPSRREVEAGGARHTLQRRVMQVLVALAHPTTEVVSHDELIRRCWGGLSVGEDAVGRCISQLRRLAAEWSDPPFAIETIAGVGYRLSPAAGEAPPVDGTSPSPTPSLPLWRRGRAQAMAVGAALLLAALAAGWVGLHPPGGLPAAKVAVLPFETLSPGQEVRYLAEGIADEVLDVLSANQVEALSRVDAAALNGAAQDRETARLGVGLLLGGSVRREGSQTRVDVRLEDARSHVTLWSADYRRDSASAADLQAQVAANVADALEIAVFARTTPPGLKDDAALSALLEANGLMRRADPQTWARLLTQAQRVVALAPDFPFGHTILSGAYAYVARWNVEPTQSRAMLATARQEAERALAMDPRDAGAYYNLAILAPTYRERETVLRKGLAVEGHPAALFGAVISTEGAILVDVGRIADALPYRQRALALDPFSQSKANSLIRVYTALGQTTAAKDLLDKSIAAWPNDPNLRAVRLEFTAFYGEPADALAILDSPAARPIDLNPQAIAAWRSFIDAKQTRRSGLPLRAAKLITGAADAGSLAPQSATLMLSALGAVGPAFDQAPKVRSKLYNGRPIFLDFLYAPPTAALRRDPRFMPLMVRLGVVDYWQSTQSWPDFCRDQIDSCKARAADAVRDSGIIRTAKTPQK